MQYLVSKVPLMVVEGNHEIEPQAGTKHLLLTVLDLHSYLWKVDLHLHSTTPWCPVVAFSPRVHLDGPPLCQIMILVLNKTCFWTKLKSKFKWVNLI